MKSKKTFIGIFLVTVIALYFIVPKIDTGLLFSYFYGDPVNVPKVKYGEFPFKLTYKNSKELIVKEDTVICEYKGVSCNAAGCYRDWKYSLRSDNEFLKLSRIDENRFAYYPTGHCGYYMNDYPAGGTYNHSFPEAAEFTKNGSMTTKSTLDSLTLLDKYDIKLLSWEYSDPLRKGEIFEKK
jgi:hypothetical protein